MIRVDNLVKHFGGVHAVDGVSLTIETGSITGLIGPNGAGKTTLFNCIAGAFPPTAGEIFLDNENITGLAPHELFTRGLLRTFQIAHEFSTLTVRDNLMMVPGEQPGESLWNACVAPRRAMGGQKKLLELGRTMMVDAKIVFLDEVGAGVNRTLLNTIGDAIQRLNQERGYTFCMIEHDMAFISRLCDPVIVMAEGEVLAQGTATEVQQDEQVIEAYLGGGRKVQKKAGRTR